MTTLLLALNLLFIIVGCEPTTSEPFQVSESNGEFYTAGVVEFRPNLFNMSSTDMLADHLKAYEAIIRSTEANETDIIIFPEGTLNSVFQMTYVPAPADNVIPCLQSRFDFDDRVKYSDFFVQLSCAARDVKKYLVINLTEKEICTEVHHDPRPCASNGLNIYNTNVVFDRDGRVISRYRKVHIYVEAKNTTLQPEYAIFETDFGVRFGHFICFDILFYTPAQELVTKYGVENIIFTSLFYSELPFLTASQLQQSWAWGNNVNLLAAGASYPTAGMTGSGIYTGHFGHVTAVMAGGNGERKLYVARVPRIRNKQQFGLSKSPNVALSAKGATDIKLMKDYQIGNYTSKLIEFEMEPNVSMQLCQFGFCCRLNANATYERPPRDTRAYKYRFGVFNGRRSYEKQEWSDIKVCALYACTNVNPLSCGEIFDANIKVAMSTKFESIEIEGDFENAGQLLIMPNTLNDQLYSLNSNDITWKKTEIGNNFNANIKLKTPQDRLLTFGIYSQYFERSGGAVIRFSFLTTFCGVIYIINTFLSLLRLKRT